MQVRAMPGDDRAEPLLVEQLNKVYAKVRALPADKPWWVPMGRALECAIGQCTPSPSVLGSHELELNLTEHIRVSGSELPGVGALTAEGLTTARHLALLAAAAHKDLDVPARRWVQFLVDDLASSQHFFLQAQRTDDVEFFSRGGVRGGTLQPKPKTSWPRGWSEKLRWLRHPEQLTVTELELALVLFKWDSDKADLAEWVRDCPHILWRVHRFLLRRYSLQLLGPFRQALCADTAMGGWRQRTRRRLGAWLGWGWLAGCTDKNLHQPPFRAGELLWLQPRLIGMTLVGYLACLGLDALKLLFFAGPLGPAVGALGVALAALWALYHVDVFKQNRGVLASARHGRPRVLGMVLRSLAVSAVLSVAPMLFWTCVRPLRGVELDPVVPLGQPALPGVVVPYLHATASWPPDWALTGRMTVGWLAMVATAAALGCLLQWFWEDTSTLEPV